MPNEKKRAAVERAEQRLALARKKQNEVLADDVHHLLSRLADDVHHLLSGLANGARHLPSRLANGASNLPPCAALSAGRLSSCLASSARHLPPGPASSTRHLPSRPAGGACRLARSSLCRRHSCSPLLFDFRVNASLLFADFAVAHGKSITLFTNLSTRNLITGPDESPRP